MAFILNGCRHAGCSHWCGGITFFFCALKWRWTRAIKATALTESLRWPDWCSVLGWRQTESVTVEPSSPARYSSDHSASLHQSVGCRSLTASSPPPPPPSSSSSSSLSSQQSQEQLDYAERAQTSAKASNLNQSDPGFELRFTDFPDGRVVSVTGLGSKGRGFESRCR